jgi:hypothetical protein
VPGRQVLDDEVLDALDRRLVGLLGRVFAALELGRRVGEDRLDNVGCVDEAARRVRDHILEVKELVREAHDQLEA